MTKVVIVYEPRKEYATIAEAIIKGGSYKVFTARSLLGVRCIQKKNEIDLVLVDAELEIGEANIFDAVYELQNLKLKGKIGFWVPSTYDRTRFMSLLVSEPICVLSRSGLPTEIREKVGVAIDKPRQLTSHRLRRVKSYSGKFRNGTIETDSAKIALAGGNPELYLLASKEAMFEGDASRGLSHLVSAFKIMPYSFTLYRRVLEKCQKPNTIYKVAYKYLKNHPVSSPYFNGGAILAFAKLSSVPKYAENLQKLIDRRVAAVEKMR